MFSHSLMELPTLKGECLLPVAFFRLNSRAGAATFLSTSMTPRVYLVYSRDSKNASRWTEGLKDPQMNGWISFSPVFLKSSPSHPLPPKTETSVIAPLCCHLQMAHTSEAGVEWFQEWSRWWLGNTGVRIHVIHDDDHYLHFQKGPCINRTLVIATADQSWYPCICWWVLVSRLLAFCCPHRWWSIKNYV